MLIDASPAPAPPVAGEKIFLFGRAASFLTELPHVHAVLVHPVLVPFPSVLPAAETVVLPAFDQLGQQSAWVEWATKTGRRLLRTPGVGQDVRPAWPAIGLQMLEEVHHD